MALIKYAPVGDPTKVAAFATLNVIAYQIGTDFVDIYIGNRIIRVGKAPNLLIDLETLVGAPYLSSPGNDPVIPNIFIASSKVGLIVPDYVNSSITEVYVGNDDFFKITLAGTVADIAGLFELQLSSPIVPPMVQFDIIPGINKIVEPAITGRRKFID